MRIFYTQLIITQFKIKYNSFIANCVGEFNMELNYQLIGIRIRKLRKSRKMTQERLSELSGISPQHLCQIESAKTKLSLPALVNICNALNVTTDEVLCDVLTADNAEQINSDIAEIFSDCTQDEIYLMLSVADSVKRSLRLKKLTLSRE